MTAPKFTPGPWVVDDYGDVQANGEDVARVVTSDNCEHALADAYLIAAAPEMYAAAQFALSNLLRNLHSEEATGAPFMGDDEHEAIALLTAALAKARGEA